MVSAMLSLTLDVSPSVRNAIALLTGTSVPIAVLPEMMKHSLPQFMTFCPIRSEANSTKSLAAVSTNEIVVAEAEPLLPEQSRVEDKKVSSARLEAFIGRLHS
jgi:hypothetical protein